MATLSASLRPAMILPWNVSVISVLPRCQSCCTLIYNAEDPGAGILAFRFCYLKDNCSRPDGSNFENLEAMWSIWVQPQRQYHHDYLIAAVVDEPYSRRGIAIAAEKLGDHHDLWAA